MTLIRKLLTRDELNQWINKRVSEIPECPKCNVEIQYTLQDQDDTGSNWSTDSILNVDQNENIELVLPHINGVIMIAKSNFNLKDT